MPPELKKKRTKNLKKVKYKIKKNKQNKKNKIKKKKTKIKLGVIKPPPFGWVGWYGHPM